MIDSYLKTPKLPIMRAEYTAIARQYSQADTAVDWNSCFTRLEAKIDAIDWGAVRDDVGKFVRAAEQPSLELWSRDLFLA